VGDVAQANLLAVTTTRPESMNQVYNIACGESTSLNQLFATLRELLARSDAVIAARRPEYRDFRPGDVRHSLADITRARELLGYAPAHTFAQGLEAALEWYRSSVVSSQ
jgi:UDP-N-acetylglucosamine 4-epimerase